MPNQKKDIGIKCPLIFSVFRVNDQYSGPVLQFDFSIINLFDQFRQPSVPYFRYSVNRRKLDELITIFNEDIDNVDYSKLENLGRFIYNNIVPREIREYLLFLEDQKFAIQLLLFTNDKEIPWETICDDKGFWAFRYSIGRIYGMSKNYFVRFPVKGKTKRKSKTPILLIYNPENNLTHAQEEGAQLENNLHKTFSVTTLCQDVSDFEMAVALGSNRYDIIHFAGHADSTSLLGMGGKLTSKEISAYSLTHHPLVFANACSTAAKGDYYGAESINIAEAFIEAGAAAFIGTLWKTNDKLSADFAAALYKYLRNGYTIGYSLLRSKQELSENPDKHNIDWASYTLYGNPESRLFAKASKEKVTEHQIQITMSNAPGTLAKILSEMSNMKVNIVQGRSITFEDEKTAGYIALIELPKTMKENYFKEMLFASLPKELYSIRFI